MKEKLTNIVCTSVLISPLVIAIVVAILVG